MIEVLVKEGDIVKAEDALITLESEKATMDIPAPWSGKVTAVRTKVGEKVSEGSLILLMEVTEEGTAPAAKPAAAAPRRPRSRRAAAPGRSSAEPASRPRRRRCLPHRSPAPLPTGENTKVHASPSVRAFARELGVNLALVNGSGPKRRILKEDVQAFVKAELSRPRGGAAGGTGLSVLEMPQVDFAKFGAIEVRPLTQDQEGIRRQPAPQLGHRAPRHPARGSRHHRTGSLPQGDERRGTEAGRHASPCWPS